MFEIMVNNEVVWSTDNQVVDVSVQTAKGEQARIATDHATGKINLVVNDVTAGSPMRLDHVEEMQRQHAISLREGEIAGRNTVHVDESLQGTQGRHKETVEIGAGSEAAIGTEATTPEDDDNEKAETPFSLNS